MFLGANGIEFGLNTAEPRFLSVASDGRDRGRPVVMTTRLILNTPDNKLKRVNYGHLYNGLDQQGSGFCQNHTRNIIFVCGIIHF